MKQGKAGSIGHTARRWQGRTPNASEKLPHSWPLPTRHMNPGAKASERIEPVPHTFPLCFLVERLHLQVGAAAEFGRN